VVVVPSLQRRCHCHCHLIWELVALVCALLRGQAACNDVAAAAVEDGTGPTAASAEGTAVVTAAAADAAVQQLLPS
jgi:hypothetical protein